MRAPVKRKVYGYSLGLETLMWLIKKGETETTKFKWILEYYGFTEELAWDIFQSWIAHKVHPECKKLNSKIHGVEE
jgi:hypothetical protein